MPYKNNADKAAWARRKYHGNEEFRKAEIKSVCDRRDRRVATEVKQRGMVLLQGFKQKQEAEIRRGKVGGVYVPAI